MYCASMSSVESITSRCRLINLLGNPIRWYSRMKGRKNPFRCHRIIPAIPRPATSRPIHTPGNNTPAAGTFRGTSSSPMNRNQSSDSVMVVLAATTDVMAIAPSIPRSRRTCTFASSPAIENAGVTSLIALAANRSRNRS